MKSISCLQWTEEKKKNKICFSFICNSCREYRTKKRKKKTIFFFMLVDGIENSKSVTSTHGLCNINICICKERIFFFYLLVNDVRERILFVGYIDFGPRIFHLALTFPFLHPPQQQEKKKKHTHTIAQKIINLDTGLFSNFNS